MTAADVRPLLARLGALGVVLSLNATRDGLQVKGRGKPSGEVMAEIKAQKPALLSYFLAHSEAETVGQALPSSSPFSVTETPTPADVSELGEATSLYSGDSVANCHNLPEVPQDRPAVAPLPDWATEAAKEGRCGSCARAVDASAEWGRYMVRCTCPPAAWWPVSPPFACHIGAKCGAYLADGADVGTGYRRKDSGKTWASLPAHNGEERRTAV